MRKHLLITLVLAFAFLLCACGSVEDTSQTTAATTEAAYAGLQIGFAKINITPEEPVPLAGNISPKSRITKENVVKTHREWGEKLAKYAMDAQSSYTPVEAGGIQMLHTTLELSNNHADDHLLEEATQIREYFTDTGDRSGAEQMCRDAGISSIYHANAIVSNANRSATSTMELDVLTLGQLAFVFAPVEMFDTNGMYIKENSPYAMTFICGYANSVKGYLPSALAWENSDYEVVVSLYAPGTAETIADTFVDMLNRLHGIE